MAKRVFSLDEIKTHNNEKSCYIVIQNAVFDVTKFLNEHPGGKQILLKVAGTDATRQFNALHSKETFEKYFPLLNIGVVASENSNAAIQDNSPVPFAEPYWYGKLQSPFYTNEHRKFRDMVRSFVEEHMKPYVHEWDEAGEYPRELHEKAYKVGIYGSNYPVEYGGTPPNKWDPFFDLILMDELARCGCGGVLNSCFFAANIGLPPILNHGSRYLKDKIARDVITGKKLLSLAISEPHAGSDVANLQTVAHREGDYYIVSGEKKFITGGVKADYYTTAVRTGGGKHGGISLLLIDRHSEGVTVRRQKTQGWWSSNTAYITFENVKVPVQNLIGEENKGFSYIMVNFNHERWALALQSNRFARICIEDSIRYARVRQTFGKRLIDHQVIRHKIAEMARQVEATHLLLENIAYQWKCGVQDQELAGIIALAKVQATTVFEFCAREASQILGGNSFIRGGHGERVERLYREVRVNAIGGGSEEILRDLAMRQARL